jgi:hypothetical protein
MDSVAIFKPPLKRLPSPNTFASPGPTIIVMSGAAVPPLDVEPLLEPGGLEVDDPVGPADFVLLPHALAAKSTTVVTAKPVTPTLLFPPLTAPPDPSPIPSERSPSLRFLNLFPQT